MKFTLPCSTFLLAALMAPLAAHADFRCDAPSMAAERTACALAKQDSPDALIRYVRRTQNVYGLYLPDYVTAGDVRRWDDTRLAAERSLTEANRTLAASDTK